MIVRKKKTLTKLNQEGDEAEGKSHDERAEDENEGFVPFSALIPGKISNWIISSQDKGAINLLWGDRHESRRGMG